MPGKQSICGGYGLPNSGYQALLTVSHALWREVKVAWWLRGISLSGWWLRGADASLDTTRDSFGTCPPLTCELTQHPHVKHTSCWHLSRPGRPYVRVPAAFCESMMS